MKNLNFGEAIQALNEGKMVARQGWDNLFVFKQIPSPKKTKIKDGISKLLKQHQKCGRVSTKTN